MDEETDKDDALIEMLGPLGPLENGCMRAESKQHMKRKQAMITTMPARARFQFRFRMAASRRGTRERQHRKTTGKVTTCTMIMMAEYLTWGQSIQESSWYVRGGVEYRASCRGMDSHMTRGE